MTNILGKMLTIADLSQEIVQRRKLQSLSQSELARRAGISRATLEALENGRHGELGFSKVSKLLSALGMELRIQEEAPPRPTLEDLLKEERDDQSLGRRG